MTAEEGAVKKVTTFHNKGNTYYLVARNGCTSRNAFSHTTLRGATAEAARLALEFKGDAFYVYAAYFKVSVGKDGRIIKNHLKYNKKQQGEVE